MGIHLGFQWIRCGQTTPYLGFQVDLDITQAWQLLVLVPSIGNLTFGAVLEFPWLVKFQHGHSRSLGEFCPMGISLCLTSWLAHSSLCYFLISIDGWLQLEFSKGEAEHLLGQQIQVVGLRGKGWHVDPLVELDQLHS